MLRTYLAVSLALMLVLTGQSMALARGTTGPAGQMVLCTGSGLVSVFVDENGAPVAPPIFCPDCALHHLVAAGAAQMVALATVATPVFRPVDVGHVHGIQACSHAMVRAPPWLA